MAAKDARADGKRRAGSVPGGAQPASGGDERMRMLLEAAGAIAWEADLASGSVVEMGPVAAIFGHPPGFTHENAADFMADIHPDDREAVARSFGSGDEGHDDYAVEFRALRPDGSIRWVMATGKFVRDADGRAVSLMGITRDVTERKAAERLQAMMVEILEVLNHARTLPDTVAELLQIIKHGTDADAVGIRLKDGAEFPYFIQNGFTEEFVALENRLCARSTEGELLRDPAGRPVLECTCGLVLSGRTDPTSPLFTPGGSFWTNDAAPLLELSREQDPRTSPRNRCIHDGYRSIALIPIRFETEVIGLLQLNHRRTGRFTPELIRFLEGVGASIGVAVARRRDAESLAAAAEQWQSTYDAVEDAIWLIDVDGRILRSNHAGRLIAGLPTEELLGRSAWEIVYGRSEPLPNGPFVRAALSLKRETSELRKGDRVYQVTLDPIVSGDRMAGAVYVLSDITGRKRMEEALVQANAQLLAVFDASSRVSIISTDPAGTIVMFNKGAEALLGYTAQEMVGKRTPLAFHLEAEVAARGAELSFELNQPVSGFDVFAILGGRGQHEEREWTYVRKDGTRLTVILAISAVRDAAGEITGYLGTAVDITNRKQAENDLRRAMHEVAKANRELERMTDRARDLAAQAEKASAAKSEFLATMSHEIRTPMNGIIGMTGLLLDSQLSAQQRQYAEVVRSCGENLLRLINDVLDFSKIEAGKLELEEVEFSLQTLLDDLAGVQAMRAQGKGLEFICFADPRLPARLRGDPVRLRQVLLNLTENAIKFTASGEVALVARLASLEGGRATVRFSVRDTGVGISAEKQAALFQPFTQVDASVTRKYGGTGLGLAICRRLVRLMGGEIGLESSAGRGSEFSFSIGLPVHDASTLPGRPELAGARILVVDACRACREAVAEILGHWKARVDLVSDGLAAVEMLRSAAAEGDAYRIVAVNRQLQGLDGEGFARLVREEAALRDTKMVIMVPMWKQGDYGQMERLGFAAYLTKPVRPADLGDLLVEVLAGRSGRSMVTRDTVQKTRHRQVHILLAEDNAVNQQVAVGILRNLGYFHVDIAANGEEAVRAVEAKAYDIVLMDVQMPEMDGLTATRRLRAAPAGSRGAKLPIVAMTAHAIQGDREACLAAGMNDYLSKPVSPAALSAVLDKWLPAGRGLPVEADAADSQLQGAPGGPAEAAGKPAPGSPPVFDRAALMERLMNDEALAKIIAETFLRDAPRQLAELRASLDAADMPVAVRHAHTLKGASANVGAERLRQSAFEAEKAGKAGDIGRMQALLPELEKAFEQLGPAMAGELGLDAKGATP